MILSFQLAIISFLDFPEYPSKYSISGKTNPSVGKTFLSPNEIFDFEVGDEFHYIEGWSDMSGNRQNKFMKIVKEKILSFNRDTVFYQFDILINHVNNHYDSSGWKKIDTTYKTTESKFYILEKEKYLPDEPQTYHEDYNDNFLPRAYKYTLDTTKNFRRILSHSVEYIINSYDSCWDMQADHFYPNYLEGCGWLDFRLVNNFDTFERYESLTYYKKGNETWGNPLIITKVDEYNSNTSLQTQIYPQPASDKAKLNFTLPQSSQVSIKLYNTLGIELKTIANTFFSEGLNSIPIDLSNFSDGVYFVVIDYQGERVVEKIVVRK